MMYFGCYGKEDILFSLITMSQLKVKLVDYRTNDDGSLKGISINFCDGTPDTSHWFFEFCVNPNIKDIYLDGKWISTQDVFQDVFQYAYDLKLEYFKPISKEEFYRIEYTEEEADKIKQEYYDYFTQFLPSETE